MPAVYGGAEGRFQPASSAPRKLAPVSEHLAGPQGVTADLTTLVAMADVALGRPTTSHRSDGVASSEPPGVPPFVPDVEIVIPVYNEEADLEAASGGSTPTWRPVPLLSDHGRRQRQQRRDLGHRRALAVELPASPPCTSTRRAGAGPCRPGGRRATRRSSPTWTSTCRPTWTPCCPSWPRCCRGTATWPSAPGWPAGARVVRGTKREVDLPQLQPPAPTTLGGAVLRRPVRVQGHPGRRAQALLPLVEDDGWFFDTELLVLAERDRHAHPRGPGGLGRRPRLAGRHRRAPRSTT